MTSPVTIVLATFNGAGFLGELITSLIAQTEPDWNLLIRDDGSTDDSLEIIRGFSHADGRIRLLTDNNDKARSARDNFTILLDTAFKSGAEYIFCCDQDDVWAPEKLSLMLTLLRNTEGPERQACLVHHDLEVVDEQLELIADSFIEYMNLSPGNESNPQRLISRNEVTGCAMACNRALLKLALPISEKAIMHDWWLALFAGFFGRLAYLPEQLVKYRQHQKNTIGAKSFWHGLNPFTNWVEGWRRGNDEFTSTIAQARAFREVLTDSAGCDGGNNAILNLYIDLPSANRWQRLKSLGQCGLWRSHWFLNIVLVLRVLLLPRVAD